MPGKVVVLKPMAWNSNGYVRPDGSTRAAGYVGQTGFGHEEWNGDQNRMWKGERVFHTEATERLLAWGDGRLGIIMTAYKDGCAYAMGVATSVRANTDDEKARIFRALRMADEVDYLWTLPSVRDRHPTLAALRKRWAEEGTHNNWRCPPSEFVWFGRPILLVAERLFPPSEPGGKIPVIIKMHSRWMAIRRDQALAIVGGVLAPDSSIMAWLSDGEFDEGAVEQKTKNYGRPRPAPSGLRRSAAPPDQSYLRYVREYEVEVHARHAALQAQFRRFLEVAGATSLKENAGAVDVRFALPGRGQVLAELKPCGSEDVRYSVRTAMGQLLDYRQRHGGTPSLLVVLEVRPTDEDSAVALANGFGIAYPRGRRFVLRWP